MQTQLQKQENKLKHGEQVHGTIQAQMTAPTIDYVIIRGAMGVGKTTTSRQLFHELSEKGIECSLLHADIVRKFINNREPTYRNRKLGVKNMIDIANNTIEDGYITILEGVFTDQELLNNMKNNISGKYLLVRLGADIDINMSRNKNPDRTFVALEDKIPDAIARYESNKWNNTEEVYYHTNNISANDVAMKIVEKMGIIDVDYEI